MDPMPTHTGALGPAAYRHVVFPHGGAGGGAPVNFAAAHAGRFIGAAPAAATEEESFVRWLFAQSGLDAANYKTETLRRRVPACLRALRAGSISDARLLVQRNPSAVKAALSAMVIGVTGFFRDAHVFSALAKDVLPELTRRGSAARIWSVGCSDGPELYSVAMLLAEQGVLHRCYLLGTDCRADAVQRAADGAYEPEAIKSVPRELLARYFTVDGGLYRIHSCLRTMVQWRTADAMTLQEPGGWDMILCRNMAIYLRGSSTARLWPALGAALRPGGVLVLGKAERPLGSAGLSMVAPCVYRRQG